MFLIIIVLISLIGLIVLHELGHFILAKRFGVKVEEFGLGIPPRIFGKKFGETIYSINLLPVGAFVKLYGEEKVIQEPSSFTGKPVWQRALIIVAGVVSFWIIAAIILGGLGATFGIPMAISDELKENLINPKVQIVAIAKNSPAEAAGIKIGDTIKQFSINNFQFSIAKVKEIQDITAQYRGKEIILTIQRGKEILDVSLRPRVSPPEGEGAMGVGLARTGQVKYPWYSAPVQGILITGKITINIANSLFQIVSNIIGGQGVPSGLQVMGPVGIFGELKNAFELGFSYFLYFIAIISIYLAIFNILPIPALDGGKLLFLGIEKIKGSPLSAKIEQNITTTFFWLLIALIIWVTIKDVVRLF